MSTLHGFHEGQTVVYVGMARDPGYGAIGHVAIMPDTDLHTGEQLRDILWFVDKGGDAHPVRADELSLSDTP